ncbi:MAG: tRNA (adenosine(37)-N6)-threonylcarbamoyltransferase complex ATPase subunit type 1 TsaE, partial [Pseudomonadota bacterium]
MSATGDHSRTLVLEGEAATVALARELALFARIGDVIALSGDVGTGKSSFARGFINALSPGAEEIEVPSPTFTLVQQYDQIRVPVAHFDFYRIREAAEVEELGFPALASQAALLAEWPERALEYLPEDRLALEFEDGADEHSRNVTLRGHGSWQPRLSRMRAVSAFLEANGFGAHRRTFLQGDASARRYERLLPAEGDPLILMDSPAMADGPVVRDGLPYSRIAHIAESVTAFVAVDRELRTAGLSAPDILAADLELGCLAIEDLGGKVFQDMVNDGRLDMQVPYETATDVLCRMAEWDWPAEVEVAPGFTHPVPAFDQPALEIEAELLLDWYLPAVSGVPCTEAARTEFLSIWRRLWPLLDCHKPVWCLRDYHSPNLIWRGEREGLDRIGIIDFQDAVRGHPAYDLASLLQDARVDVNAETEANMLERYLRSRENADDGFERNRFLECYAVLAAQRTTKILGIFMRLKERDGKPGYLRH